MSQILIEFFVPMLENTVFNKKSLKLNIKIKININ